MSLDASHVSRMRVSPSAVADTFAGSAGPASEVVALAMLD